MKKMIDKSFKNDGIKKMMGEVAITL